MINSPRTQSQPSLQEMQKPQSKTSLVMKHRQPIPSKPNKRRKNSISKFIGFNVSDEDGKVNNSIT